MSSLIKVTRGCRDTIHHMRGGHDDIANAVAGACVMVQERGADLPLGCMAPHTAQGCPGCAGLPKPPTDVRFRGRNWV